MPAKKMKKTRKTVAKASTEAFTRTSSIRWKEGAVAYKNTVHTLASSGTDNSDLKMKRTKTYAPKKGAKSSKKLQK